MAGPPGGAQRDEQRRPWCARCASASILEVVCRSGKSKIASWPSGRAAPARRTAPRSPMHSTGSRARGSRQGFPAAESNEEYQRADRTTEQSLELSPREEGNATQIRVGEWIPHEPRSGPSLLRAERMRQSSDRAFGRWFSSLPVVSRAPLRPIASQREATLGVRTDTFRVREPALVLSGPRTARRRARGRSRRSVERVHQNALEPDGSGEPVHGYPGTTAVRTADVATTLIRATDGP